MLEPRRSLLPAVVAALVMLALTGPAGAGRADPTDPIPVLPGERILLPGPRRLGLEGPAADPSTIGNFRGLVALAYLRGKARHATSRRAIMANDIRIFQGDYVAADGVARRGTFAFV
jgi:hypothetical protein